MDRFGGIKLQPGPADRVHLTLVTLLGAVGWRSGRARTVSRQPVPIYPDGCLAAMCGMRTPVIVQQCLRTPTGLAFVSFCIDGTRRLAFAFASMGRSTRLAVTKVATATGGGRAPRSAACCSAMERIIKFAIGQKACTGGNARTVELQLEAVVESSRRHRIRPHPLAALSSPAIQ